MSALGSKADIAITHSNGLLPRKRRSDPIPLVVNPCCNRALQAIVGALLSTWEKQCDGVISSKVLPDQLLFGRSLRARSSPASLAGSGYSCCIPRRTRRAKSFGLTIPQALLVAADEVIE
jgi:hypothetical protein